MRERGSCLVEVRHTSRNFSIKGRENPYIRSMEWSRERNQRTKRERGSIISRRVRKSEKRENVEGGQKLPFKLGWKCDKKEGHGIGRRGRQQTFGPVRKSLSGPDESRVLI